MSAVLFYLILALIATALWFVCRPEGGYVQYFKDCPLWKR